MAEPVLDERRRLVVRLAEITRAPLDLLSIAWLGLMLVDYAGLLPQALQRVSEGIWALFVVVFLLELWVAPDRRAFLKANWFSALTLVAPALRILRIFQGLRVLARLRALRALDAAKVLGSVNDGLRSLQRALGRHQLGYVLAFTVFVVLGAAALLFHFERTAVLGPPRDGGAAIDTFADALWWAGGAASFAGSDYSVRTTVGRALRLFMSFYSWSGFGYLTATVASRFLDPPEAAPEDPPAPDPLATLTAEVQALREQLERLSARLGGSDAERPPIPPHE